MAVAEGRGDKWSDKLVRFLEFHVCRLLRKLALIPPLVLLLHLGSLVVFFASGQPPLVTQHTAGGVELTTTTTTTEGVGLITEETNHGANSSYYVASSDVLANSYLSEPPQSAGFLGSSAAKKSLVLDAFLQEGGKDASTASGEREGAPVASEPQQMSSDSLGETASGRGVLPTTPSSAFLGCPIGDHPRRRSPPSEAQSKRADDEHSSTTVPSIPVSSAGFSFPTFADVSTSRRQARGLSPNDCASTTTTTSSQTSLHTQPASVIHRTLGASAFPVEAGQAPLPAVTGEDFSGLGNTHDHSGALVTHDPPEVLETLLLPRLRADLQENLHDSYHSYYFTNDGRESSGNDGDVVSTQPLQPLPQDNTRQKDRSEKPSGELGLEGSANKVKDHAGAVDLMLDAVNTKLNLALPGIEVLTKPTLALAKPFISTAWSLFGLFASPFLAVKKSLGKAKSPSPDDRKHPDRTCCADCADEDEECVSGCSTESCESKQTCVSAGYGAYSGFCSTVCATLTGMSVMPAPTAELLDDEACREFCASRVRRLCETHACEDFGCYAENCARLASFRCG